MTGRPATQAEDFPVTHRSVFAIAAPMTLAFISTPLVGLADTWTIGQLGDAALIGAIAVGSIIFDILFTTMNFLRSGTTGLVAQAFGAGRKREEAAIFFRALILAVGIGVLAILLQTPLLQASLWFIGGTERVQEAVVVYFSERVLAAPLTLSNYSILGYFLGRGEAMTGLALQTVLNLTNIALNILFVLVFDWGVAGVAFASVLGELVALLLGLLLVWLRLRKTPWPTRAEVFDRAELIRMMGVNRDIMIRSFALLFAFATFTRLSAQQGEVMLAANAILEKYFLLAGYFLDGIATAAEQLAGRAVGARRRAPFARAVKLCALWSVVLAGLATLFFLVAGGPILDFMTPAEDVRALGREFLDLRRAHAHCRRRGLPHGRGVIGATWSRDMRNMMLASLALFLLAAYALTPAMGNTGLWLSFLLFLGVRGITLAAYSAAADGSDLFGRPIPATI
jgi:MATE family multidrug resistance protein